jgi:branched-chain amino acid transport system substrate-binding protein
MKRYCFLVILSVIIFVSATPGGWAKENVIRLGAAISLSGKLAQEGTSTAKGFQLAVKTINERGLLKLGNETYRLDLKIYDDEGNAHTCAKLVEKLISEDKIDYILGPYSTTITLPASSITEKNHRVMVVVGASVISVFTRGYKYLFGLYPDAKGSTDPTLELFKSLKNPQIKKLAFLTQNDIFAQYLREGAISKAKELGFEIVSDQYHPTEVLDLSTELRKAQAAGMEALIQQSHFNNAYLVYKQMLELGIKVPTFLNVGPIFPRFRNDFGDNANYVFTESVWHDSMKTKCSVFGSASEFSEIVKKAYGHPADYMNGVGSAGVICFMNAFMDAYKKDGKITPDTVRDAFARMDVQTFFGHIKFKPNGIRDASFLSIQLQPGGSFVVYPKEYATRDAIFPIPSKAK